MQKVLEKLQIVLLIITFLCSVAELFLLPETVAVHWMNHEERDPLFRAVACWIPFIVNVICFVGWKISSIHFQGEIEANKASKKFRITYGITWGIVACMGVILHLILFAAHLSW